MRRLLPILIAVLLTAIPWTPPVLADGPDKYAPDRMPNKFTWVRIRYRSYGGQDESWYYYEGRRWDRWETDYPEADENFLIRLQELTTISADPTPLVMTLDDPRLMNYPFIYMSDVGWQELSDTEVTALRDYLNRGGFLWADDFWGSPEFDNFAFVMKRVFPDLEWVTIPKDHPIMNVVFPLEGCPQVPARVFATTGQTWDPPEMHKGRGRDIRDVQTVNFKGLFDKEGRLIAVTTHNTDLGDGWEREAEDPWYFEAFSIKAYAMGVNIIVYALTH